MLNNLQCALIPVNLIEHKAAQFIQSDCSLRDRRLKARQKSPTPFEFYMNLNIPAVSRSDGHAFIQNGNSGQRLPAVNIRFSFS